MLTVFAGSRIGGGERDQDHRVFRNRLLGVRAQLCRYTLHDAIEAEPEPVHGYAPSGGDSERDALFQ